MNRSNTNFIDIKKKNNFFYKNTNTKILKKKNTGGLRTKSIMKKNLYSRPLISIIVATYNSEKFLEKCLQSIIDQSYQNFEIIIVDNKSTDKTLGIIKKYEKFIDIWISEADNGIFHAMNKGIKISKGKIISILNSDDYFYSNALKTIVKYFNSNSNIDFVFGTVKKNKVFSGFKPQKIRWKFNIYPSHSVGFFIKKKIHDKIGLYNLKYKHSNDYDFFYRLIVKNKINGISTKRAEVIGNFRPGGFSSRLSFFDRLFTELRIRFDNKQNFIDLLIIFIGRCFFEIINKFKL